MRPDASVLGRFLYLLGQSDRMGGLKENDKKIRRFHFAQCPFFLLTECV